ncbi:hypothetical protein A2755_02995 [Candidatus Wolfebacteria bacterium RIFCSPHIGHO2_01_FULL_48_22]|uniref:Uncharacterized protein n=1 Tax=Candidatus Wolfebacteria bacterium RIFCSPHIGHO2_01_FULL_48_22 TaxID=1802555 RepID=A0A1F8DPA1_9BACT|nr:MAG: hypothetical protein A2755_02995 [Candidatus Wolfebacteria bacterium RIFCSPHIGHO2_01_FULL_48_22]
MWKIRTVVSYYFRYRSLLQVPRDAAAIHRIAREPVNLPTHNAACFATLDATHHFFKHRTARHFRTSLFYELLGNIQSIASRKRSQLNKLRFNRKHLFIFGIGAFASVEKKAHTSIV